MASGRSSAAVRGATFSGFPCSAHRTTKDNAPVSMERAFKGFQSFYQRDRL